MIVEQNYYQSPQYIMPRRRQYGVLHLIFDLVMITLTGGLWVIWILIRMMRASTR